MKEKYLYQNGTYKACASCVTGKLHVRGKKISAQHGLSLVEVMIALAITTLVSLALFQSVVQWFVISAKTAGAAERTVSALAYERQFRTIVRGLIPGWKEIKEETFIGTPDFFSGIATHLLHKGEPAMSVVTLQLVSEDESTKLNYLAFETGWTMASFDQTAARFDYLGLDGNWYPNWPPEIAPAPGGEYNDYEILGVPLLPSAIRLSLFSRQPDQTGEVQSMIIADVLNDPELPSRVQDVLDGFGGVQ